jgi:methylated-DNA-[protein]-cysteine S-methyltransferase
MIQIGSLPSSLVGTIWIGISPGGLYGVKLGGDETDFRKSLSRRSGFEITLDQSAISDIAQQLDEYFQGNRRTFTITIDWSQLRPFEEAVLRETLAIPFGDVRTYGQIAEKVGRPKSAARAVGRAEATNPIPIIIPCHRVVGADGTLRGYGGAGGIDTKAWLLNLEGHQLLQQQRFPW